MKPVTTEAGRADRDTLRTKTQLQRHNRPFVPRPQVVPPAAPSQDLQPPPSSTATSALGPPSQLPQVSTPTDDVSPPPPTESGSASPEKRPADDDDDEERLAFKELTAKRLKMG